MKKKVLKASLLSLCAVALVVVSVLTTIALLTSSSSVSNVFTVGEVSINMYEHKVNSDGTKVEPIEKVDANSYHLVPGKTYIKNPTIEITTKTADDKMYLFVKTHNDIRGAEAGNFAENPDTTVLTMREQMHKNGWVEYVRSGDGVEIIWVYGTRDPESGKITPTVVDKSKTQKRANGEEGPAGEFLLCEQFTIHEKAQVSLYGAATVTFTGFAIQNVGFEGDNETGHALTQKAWEAIKGSIPYDFSIISPVNPYTGSTQNPYDPVEGVTDPVPVVPNGSANQ